MVMTGDIISAMIAYNAGDSKRVNHFLKVYAFAKAIGEKEQLSEEELAILEIAAICHDIGIRNSEIEYGSSSGTYQQMVGPPEARKLLEQLFIQEHIIERVCWLIGHHHTYTDIQGMDYQILIEADFLVNANEDMLDAAAIRHFDTKIFKTQTGKLFLEELYYGRGAYGKDN